MRISQTDAVSIEVNVEEAATRLAELLSLLEDGAEVLITREGKPVARMVAVEPPRQRPLGFVRGKLPESFFDPLPETW